MYQITMQYPKGPKNRPNGHTNIYTNHLQLQDPPNIFCSQSLLNQLPHDQEQRVGQMWHIVLWQERDTTTSTGTLFLECNFIHAHASLANFRETLQNLPKLGFLV
jgi:hypothetical protein